MIPAPIEAAAVACGVGAIAYCLWQIATGRAFTNPTPWPARSWDEAPALVRRFHAWYAQRFGRTF